MASQPISTSKSRRPSGAARPFPTRCFFLDERGAGAKYLLFIVPVSATSQRNTSFQPSHTVNPTTFKAASLYTALCWCRSALATALVECAHSRCSPISNPSTRFSALIENTEWRDVPEGWFAGRTGGIAVRHYAAISVSTAPASLTRISYTRFVTKPSR